MGRFATGLLALVSVSPALRTEALVRLGVARREKGDWQGAFRAFEQASKDAGLDRETKALLVRGVGGVLPGDDRWAEIWRQVSFTRDRSDPKRPTLEILWPGVPPARAEERRHDDGAIQVSLDFESGDLQDIFRLFADISGLNVVVFPGTQGRASLKVNQEPWPLVLRRILAPNGLAYEWNDNVLVIGLPETLRPTRPFTGHRVGRPDRSRQRPRLDAGGRHPEGVSPPPLAPARSTRDQHLAVGERPRRGPRAILSSIIRSPSSCCPKGPRSAPTASCPRSGPGEWGRCGEHTTPGWDATSR